MRAMSTILHGVGYHELLILVKAMREPVRGISEEFELPTSFVYNQANYYQLLNRSGYRQEL